jgi:hypothetical protein
MPEGDAAWDAFDAGAEDGSGALESDVQTPESESSEDSGVGVPP